jgi:hypothetical protein
MIWSTRTKQEMRTLTGLAGRANECAYSPDGSWVVAVAEDRTLSVWNAKTSERVALLVAGMPMEALALSRAGRGIAAGDSSGRLYIMQLAGIEFGAPIVTGVHLYRLNGKGWELEPTAQCWWCGQRFAAPFAILDTICGIAREANISSEDSPCMVLPEEAWEEPRLLSECPHCNQGLRFNPFIVDNRERY